MPTVKPPLVFVPGLGVTGEAYEPLLRRLRIDYDVRVAMHGLRLPKRLDWPFFYRAIEEAAPRGRFRLLGHSMGGAICLAYAAHAPDRLERTVAVAPPVTPSRTKRITGPLRFKLFRRLLNLWVAVRSGMPGHTFRVLAVRRMVLSEGRRAALYAWINRVDLRDRLDRVRRTRVLWPRHEEVLYGDHLEVLRRFPNLEVRIIPGGHNYTAIYPQPVYDAIREALDD